MMTSNFSQRSHERGMKRARNATTWLHLSGPANNRSSLGSCAPRRVSRNFGKREAGARKPYELLAPVYSWFTEGFDTKDLVDAKQLLDELEQ